MARLYVICGHGAGDPGACANGYAEAERVRALGARIAELGGSEVCLLDTSRDWYADGGISSLSIPSDACLVELHMDSASASARGGHVVIAAGAGGADGHDRALAGFISGIFPGRSQSIVERSDLANPNRALARGINYRLVENGFITNIDDVLTFNSRMDEIAEGYLAAFGIESEGDIVKDEDIERIANRVWEIGQGSATADRVYRCTSMLKAMCGIGPEDTSDPKGFADSIRAWTMGRWERMLKILKGLSGIPQEDTGDGMIATPMHVSLSDEDVERVAKRVAEIMKEEPME